MTLVDISKLIASVLTILTGLYSIFRPKAVQGFTGLHLPGSRGMTEVRAILGAPFVAMGIAPILFSSQAMYQMAGFIYLIIAAVRFIAMMVDRSFERSNLISLLTEVVLGIVLIL